MKFSEAKAAFDSHDANVLKAWEGSETMALVNEIAEELILEEIGDEEAQA